MDITRVLEVPVKEFFRQPRGLIGPGSWEMAGPEAKTMGLEHVLIVTTGLRGTGIVDEVKRNFEDAGVAVSVYDKVESNPKDYNCMDAYQMFTDDDCDGFVSVGGGSATDCTKGARVVAAHDGRNVNEFQGLFKSENLENPPHIAINTTVGTGSETTPFAVINDMSSDKAPHKWVGVDRAMTTTLAINDPLLMMTLPQQYVAYTGFDTVAHAMEAYVGRIQHTSGTPLALEALRMVSDNLREAAANPHNYEAMSAMTWAQYIAAQAFSCSLLGILHSLSHAVCAYSDIHHGLNNGIGIARVMEFNQPAAGGRMGDIAGAFGVDTANMTTPQASDAAIDEIVRLAKDVGIPDNFGDVPDYPKDRRGTGWYEGRSTEIGGSDEDLDGMATHLVEDACTPGNPRDISHAQAKEILRDCVQDPMDRGAKRDARKRGEQFNPQNVPGTDTTGSFLAEEQA